MEKIFFSLFLSYLFLNSSLSGMDIENPTTLLLLGIEHNSPSEVLTAIYGGARLNFTKGNATLIEYALQLEAYNCALLLAHQGAPTTREAFINFLTIMVICNLRAERYMILLETLLEKLRIIDWPQMILPYSSFSPLIFALSHSRMDIAKILLRYGAPDNDVIPILAFLSQENLGEAHYLLDHGARLNPRDTEKIPLEEVEDYDALKFLLSHGASPNLPGHTILEHTILPHDKFLMIVKKINLLLRHGAIFRKPDHWNKLYSNSYRNFLVSYSLAMHRLIRAIIFHDLSTIETFLPDPEKITKEDMQKIHQQFPHNILNRALFYATGQGYHVKSPEIIARLLQYGASPFLYGKENESAIVILERILQRETFDEEYTEAQKKSYKTILRLFLNDAQLLIKLYAIPELSYDNHVIVAQYVLDIPDTFMKRIFHNNDSYGLSCRDVIPSLLTTLISENRISYNGDDEYPMGETKIFNDILDAIAKGNIKKLSNLLENHGSILPLFRDNENQPFALKVAKKYLDYALSPSRKNQQSLILKLLERQIKF